LKQFSSHDQHRAAGADFTGDGLVDIVDYLEFLNLYDTGC